MLVTPLHNSMAMTGKVACLKSVKIVSQDPLVAGKAVEVLVVDSDVAVSEVAADLAVVVGSEEATADAEATEADMVVPMVVVMMLLLQRPRPILLPTSLPPEANAASLSLSAM